MVLIASVLNISNRNWQDHMIARIFISFPMRTTCQLVKGNISSFIGPIIQGVRNIWLKPKYFMIYYPIRVYDKGKLCSGRCICMKYSNNTRWHASYHLNTCLIITYGKHFVHQRCLAGTYGKCSVTGAENELNWFSSIKPLFIIFQQYSQKCHFSSPLSLQNNALIYILRKRLVTIFEPLSLP